MVYESRVGDVFVLGASSWRIEDITADQVLVSPAPGQPGKLPFWHGDAPGRPAELGRALGAYCRELAAAPSEQAPARLRADGLDELAAANLVRYLADQREATGYLPDDRTLVMERFRDELGDWRLVLHSPFGARVHAPVGAGHRGPAARALRGHGRAGHAHRRRDRDPGPGHRRAAAGRASPSWRPEEVEQLVTDELGGSALFASRFRECAARALLLPRRRPGRRSPLWQQRQRSAQLLAVAPQVRHVPDRAGDRAGVPAGRVRRARPGRPDAGPGQPARSGWSRWRHPRRPRSAGRCCSATSARSCTRATRRSPSAAPRRWRWTRLAAGRAARPGRPARAARPGGGRPRPSAELQRLTPEPGLPGRWRPWPTCCAPSGRCPRPRWPSAARTRRGRGLAGRAGAGPAPGAAGAGRRARPAGPPSRTPGGCATRSACRCPRGAGRVHRAGARPARRPGGPVRPRARAVHARPTWPPGTGSAWRWSPARCAGWPRSGRVAEGEFLPGRRGTQWCDAGVLRLLRRRCLAKLRKEAEPVPAGGAGRVPARLAERGPARWPGRDPAVSSRAGAAGGGGPGCGVRGRRPAGRGGGARLGAGDADPARPGARLPARHAG